MINITYVISRICYQAKYTEIALQSKAVITLTDDLKA